jgi:FMN phosphatase YigB (HAD superfamily)
MKYLAIDIGNVLCYVDFRKLFEAISKHANTTLEEAKYFIQRIQKSHDLGLTDIAAELRDKLHIRSEVIIDIIKYEWEGCITANPYFLGKLDEWQEKYDLKIALLSNIGPEHAEMMKKTLGSYNFYREAIKHFSCQVGARKPNDLFYISFLMSNPEFKNCVYIDDLSENLEASQKFGFKTFQFTLDDAKNYFGKMGELENIVERL